MNYFKRNISITKTSTDSSFDNYLEMVSKGTSVQVLDKSTNYLWYKLQWKIMLNPFGHKPIAVRQINVNVKDEPTKWRIQIQPVRFLIYFIIFWNALVILMVSPIIYFNYKWTSVGAILAFLIILNSFNFFIIRSDLSTWGKFIKNE